MAALTASLGVLGFLLLATLLAARALTLASGRRSDHLSNRLLLPIVPLVPICLLLAIGNLLTQTN